MWQRLLSNQQQRQNTFTAAIQNIDSSFFFPLPLPPPQTVPGRREERRQQCQRFLEFGSCTRGLFRLSLCLCVHVCVKAWLNCTVGEWARGQIMHVGTLHASECRLFEAFAFNYSCRLLLRFTVQATSDTSSCFLPPCNICGQRRAK